MKLRQLCIAILFVCLSSSALARSFANIEIIGHRGVRAALPENTLPTLKYAIDLGVDAIEIDVNVTSDNVLVVHHDQTINSENCQYKDGRAVPKNLLIRKLTLMQIKQFDCGAKINPQFSKQQAVPGSEIPTLSEVFEMAKAEGGANVSFTIEPKSDPKSPHRQPSPSEFAELILKEVHGFGLEQNVTIHSFDYRILAEVRNQNSTINIAALLGGDPMTFAEVAAASKANTISPYFKLLTKENVEAIHKAGFKVIPWTLNTEEDWTKILDMGVDGIITDDPASLMKMLNRT